MSLKQSLDEVDRELVTAVQKMHVGAQVYRFLRLALFGIISGVVAHWTTSGAMTVPTAAATAGALETAFRQFYPAFPLGGTTSAVTQAVKDQATQLATAAINAHVEDYQAGLANQAMVTSMLAEARKLGQPATGGWLTPPSHLAEPAPAAVDAEPPAASA